MTRWITLLHGTTTGLSRPRPDMRGSRTRRARFDPEQVYVYSDLNAGSWIDNDEAERPPRSVVIEGWVGYNIPGAMHLTRQQAKDLMGLLADAITYDIDTKPSGE